MYIIYFYDKTGHAVAISHEHSWQYVMDELKALEKWPIEYESIVIIKE